MSKTSSLLPFRFGAGDLYDTPIKPRQLSLHVLPIAPNAFFGRPVSPHATDFMDEAGGIFLATRRFEKAFRSNQDAGRAGPKI